MNILAIIPARGGSKEIPRKNLIKIGGKSLVELAVNSSIESKLISRTILSSDDNEIINEGKRCGCEVPFKRPDDLGTDTSSTFDVIRHAYNWLNNNENWNADILVILQPTTPFRKGHHIDNTIKLLLDSKSDAAITIREPDYSPYWMMKKNSDNKIINIIDKGNKYKRRQDTPKVYQPAGMVYAFKQNLLDDINTIFPYKDTRGYQVSKEDSINIDSHIDYELAKMIYNNRLL